MSNKDLYELLGMPEKRPPKPTDHSGEVEEKDERNPVFGTDRTRQRQIMLSLRKANQTAKLIPYHHILQVEVTADRLVTLYCTGTLVTIEGEKLGTIVDRIARYELAYVQEEHPRSPAMGPNGERIKEIRFEESSS